MRAGSLCVGVYVWWVGEGCVVVELVVDEGEERLRGEMYLKVAAE